MKLSKLNQSGFSLLHVLPAVLIVAAIAVIGVRVLTESHAATVFACTTSWSKSTSGTVHAQVSVHNNTTGTQSGIPVYLYNSSGRKAYAYDGSNRALSNPYTTGTFAASQTKVLNFYFYGWTTRYTWYADLHLPNGGGIQGCSPPRTGL